MFNAELIKEKTIVKQANAQNTLDVFFHKGFPVNVTKWEKAVF